MTWLKPFAAVSRWIDRRIDARTAALREVTAEDVRGKLEAQARDNERSLGDALRRWREDN